MQSMFHEEQVVKLFDAYGKRPTKGMLNVFFEWGEKLEIEELQKIVDNVTKTYPKFPSLAECKMNKSILGEYREGCDSFVPTHHSPIRSRTIMGAKMDSPKSTMNGKTKQVVKAFGKRLIYNPQLLRSSTAVAKAHVRQYLRRTKSGKLVTVKDHRT